MTCGYITASGEPGVYEIPAALEEAVREDPGLREHYSAEDISPTLLAEMLETLEREEV